MSESSLSLRGPGGRGGRKRAPLGAGAAAKRPAGKKRRAGDKRDRILKAAVKVFARAGFHATRVSEVAKAAGVADGTIYLYFKSKEELLTSLFEDRVEKLLAHMTEQKNAPERLRAIIDMQLGLLEGERELAEVITVILRQSTKIMKELAAPHFLAYLDLIAKVVAEGQAAGDFRRDVSPNLAARAIFGALDGITLTWALGRAEQGALARAASQLGDVLLRGLAPE
jgi:TetR/AcrR family transcriptional regulator, fatty acid metabolism regulator protein